MTRPSFRSPSLAALASLSLLFLSAVPLAGCGSSADGQDYAGASPSGTGLSPGGAQDFGRFKAILEAGKLPGPETLDQVGFFAEHKIGTPPTSCADPVCADAQLGAMANMISGSTCTLMHLSLGTPVDPRLQPRPPLDLAIVVEMNTEALLSRDGQDDLQYGLNQLLNGIDDADSVTVVSLGQTAKVLADKVPGTLRDSVRGAITSLPLETTHAAIEQYEGLRQAVDTLGPTASGRHRRIVLVSGGQPSGSIRSERSLRLLRTFAESSGGVTVVAVGEVGDLPRLQGLADAGAGTLYYAKQTSELPALFSREVGYSLIPVAQKVAIRLAPGSSYRLREVFGISKSSWQLSAEGGEIRIPALFAAWRKSATTIDDRRGGGGAILVEVLPRVGAPNVRPATVSDITVEYDVPGSPRKTTQLQLSAPDGPFGTPTSGRFSNKAVEKGFVVLNLYVGLRMASERSAVGDLRGAYDVLGPLHGNVSDWNRRAADVEIFDDLRYVEMFIDLLAKAGADSLPPRAVQYSEPWIFD